MTARLVPQEYQRDSKGTDQNQHSSTAGIPLRCPGAYSICPTANMVQDKSTNNGDDDEAINGTNDERNKPELLLDDPESALEAQVVPERDLNREVQQQMEAITIDPITVAPSKTNNNAPNGPPGARRNSTLMITFGILTVLVAGGCTIGIIASKNEKRTKPTIAATIAPIVVSDMELARDIFTPLSGNETLWDESLPQYKALWWIVHEDLAKMMMTMQDETESSLDMIVKCYVMALLYFATDGPNWFEPANFLGNLSICDWYDSKEIENGVRCNDYGSVVTLKLGKTCVCLCCLQSTLG
jgi:hypothetical protein